MSDVTQAYEMAKDALGAEAAAIMESSPAYSDSDRVGPYGAVTLTMEALWQKPELVEPIADYFLTLLATRAGSG